LQFVRLFTPKRLLLEEKAWAAESLTF